MRLLGPTRINSELVNFLGKGAAKQAASHQGGTIDQALTFGELILLSIPYASVQQFGQEYGEKLASKIVIETGNPYPQRDGAIAEEVRSSNLGTGVWSARWLPGARLVRGFNSVWDKTLAKEAHRPKPR